MAENTSSYRSATRVSTLSGSTNQSVFSAASSYPDSTKHASRPYTYPYRQGRRRWVPKGVVLLAILFIVGLLGACQSSSQPVAAIVVPLDATANDSRLLVEGIDGGWITNSVTESVFLRVSEMGS